MAPPRLGFSPRRRCRELSARWAPGQPSPCYTRAVMPVRFDAQAAARLERIYASPEIVEQRARTRAALRIRPGERGLDIGCGPGFLSCELVREVGPSGRIVGIDASPEMLEAARARAAREG